MDYNDRVYTSTGSQPPKVESEVDRMPVADREEIEGILSELGIDENAEDVLENEEYADILMYAELTPESAENYWKATLENSEVVADVQIAFIAGDRIKGPYSAGFVVKPAYDVFKVEEYLPEDEFNLSATGGGMHTSVDTD